MNNLVLGTAALGFPYGIVNKEGRLSYGQVREIVKTAWELGVREFDTAQMYEASEFYLGQAFIDLGIQDEVKVITKLDPDVDQFKDHERRMLEIVESSFFKLNVKKLYGLLLHREYQLDSTEMVELLCDIKERGLTEKIGASVYQPSYALKALNIKELDIVQFPTCILDRRFERAGIFKLAKDKRKEIYLRNIFLQGLLLQNPEDCPISWIRPEIEKLNELVKYTPEEKLEFIMGYMRATFPDVKLIFGVETSEQLKEVVFAYNKNIVLSDNFMMKTRETFADVNDDVLIPKTWKEKK